MNKVPELVIRTSEGVARLLALEADRMTLGRSSTNQLCYADDAGLSRQHLVIEKDETGWSVRDLGSKNGTQVNGVRLAAPHRLKAGDRIMAGHLVLEYDPKTAAEPAPLETVVFVESSEADMPSAATTVVTSLDGLMEQQKALSGKPVFDSGPHLQALIRAGRELAEHRPLAELFQVIMGLSVDAVGASRGVLMTLENNQLVPQAARGEGFRISTAVRDQVLEKKASLLVRDASMDEMLRLRMSIVEQKVRSIMAVPLQTTDRVIGLIYVDSPHFIREFTREDLNLLTVMANVAATRIEHARLAEVEQTERIYAKELDQAAQIQRGLLPAQAPEVAGLDVAGYNRACRGVGGDYYDFFPFPDGRIAMVVADVAGKGMPAALLMSSLQARVQVLVEDMTDLAATVTRLNRIIHSNCPDNRFITFFMCVVDLANGEILYCNAGHNPPLLARADGTVEKLEGGGIVLGILPQAKYQSHRCRFGSGDALMLFSDGVTEATPPDQDEEFGDQRLAELLASNRSEPAENIINLVNETLVTWTAGGAPADDITLVVARAV